jgi:hypothetical protein
LKWASWNNKRSFWIQKEDLLQLLKDIGFDLVFEQFDVMDDIVSDMTDGFYHKIDRVMLVAIKSGLPIETAAGTTRQRRPLEKESTRAPTGELTSAESRAAAAAQDASLAQATLNAVYASTSWRITAPLRRAGRLLNRLESAVARQTL